MVAVGHYKNEDPFHNIDATQVFEIFIGPLKTGIRFKIFTSAAIFCYKGISL